MTPVLISDWLPGSGSGTAASPASPVQVNGTHVPWSKSSLGSSFRSERQNKKIFESLSTSVRRSSNGGRRSRSEEKVHSPTRDPGSYADWRAPGQRANTEMADFKNRGFQVSCGWRRAGHVTPVLTSDWLQLLPSKLPPGGQQGNTAWSARYKSSEALPNLEGSSITAIKKENNVKNKRQVDLVSDVMDLFS